MVAGAPTKYNAQICDEVRKLCLLGATDADIADFYGVCETTVNNWKIKHPKFLESIRDGKKMANANVAASLYQRAIGYEHQEEKVFCNMGDIKTHTVTKHYPPETQAASLFLRNREPALWRDKQDVDLTSSDGSMSPDVEAKEKARESIKKEFD